MARARSGNAIQSKIQMTIYGEPFTGKSTMASQFAYMKNPDGSPFKVLYLDPESGSIDDYLGTMKANGVNPANIWIVYTQSLTEVLDYISRATNNEDFYEIDDDGNETDTVVLDGDGKPFRPDAIVVDGTSVLNLTTKQGIIEFSKKRANVKADIAGLIGDARLVKVDGAGLELKDYQTINFKGQDLILALNASGKHYIVTARETDEKEQRIIDGKKESVSTGRKIPEGFKGMQYNCKTCIRMYRDPDDYDMVKAFVEKDRTGVHSAGEILEDPSLIDWQEVINKTANNAHVVIKNGLSHAVETEEAKYAQEMGVSNETKPEDEPAPAVAKSDVKELRAQALRLLKSISDPVKKSNAKAAVAQAGLPTQITKIEDTEVLEKIIATIKANI